MDVFLRTVYYANLTPIHEPVPFDKSIKLSTKLTTIARDGNGNGDGSG